MAPAKENAMPTPMSAFGFVHTAVSLLPIGFGLYALLRHGKIDLATRSGNAYFVTMLLGSATGFVIFAHGGFSLGHALTLLVVALLLAAALAPRMHWLGGLAPYVQTAGFSTSFLLLMVFATTEGLTRLPPEHPYASGADAPELMPVRVALLGAFIAGLGWQLWRLRMARRHK
jgi:hypothetical protein